MKRLGGIIAAAVTPRRQCEADMGAMLEVVDWLCAAGVQGIALMGSTGEFTAFSGDERIRLTYLAIKRSRVPVLAGISHACLDGALELAREATSAGADGLLLMPPYFFRYGQDDIREFYVQFIGRAGRVAPVYVYNIPCFGNGVTAETALDVLATGLFAGIKDSSGDLEAFRHLQDAPGRSNFTLLAGNDAIFRAARSAGADGGVSGIASAVPELMLALERAVSQGCATAPLEARLHELIAWIDRFPVPVALKAAAAERGLKTGELAVPISPGKQQLLGEFREWFRAWLPQVLKEIDNED